jgi:tRNA threonylcarbamoyladenosine modification (KEOPS) complex  Pcc1 subunit
VWINSLDVRFRLGHEGIATEETVRKAYAFNEAALRVYERVGFREIGRRRNSIVSLGRRWDEILMDVIAEDWAARAGTIGTWTDPALETRTTSSASPPAPPPTS